MILKLADEEEKRSNFRTPSRLTLPNVVFCFSEKSQMLQYRNLSHLDQQSKKGAPTRVPGKNQEKKLILFRQNSSISAQADF